MRKRISFLLLLCILPFVATAMAWSASGLLTGSIDPAFLTLMACVAIAFANLEIHLPRTNVFLSVSDAFIVFVLIDFGGETAIFLKVATELYGAIHRAILEKTHNILDTLTNVSITIVTIFVTAIAVQFVLGYPVLELADFRNGTLLMLVGALTLIPSLTSSLIASVFTAARGQQSFAKVFRAQIVDALMVCSCAAFMGGLLVVALHEANMFLFVTTAGVLSLLHILFRRYGDEQRKSIERAQKAERERAELAEQHVIELQGYVEQIEAAAKELRQSREKFRWAAYHDGLTNLPNRNRLIDEVKLELAHGQAEECYRFAFLMLDLKNFKVVNESLGRPIGDTLIVDVGERLEAMVPANATVGRIGGDKFALLLPAAGQDHEIVDFAKKVLEAIATPFEIGEKQIYLAGILGISVGIGEGEEAEDVLRDAEMAMHRARERNRGFVMFERRMLTHAVSRLQLETDLRMAVERDEFEIFYQPIVDLQTKHIGGFEALVRWNHPTLGRMSPDKFIPIAEATGLIIPMTKQILSKACTQLVEWNSRSKNVDPLFASVNLSGTHFGHRGLVGHITSVLDKTGLDPRLLKLEITETVVMENAEAAISMLKQIKELGVQISIDDFGTGYSSLSYLQRFPIDTLKIDRAFVRSLEDGRQNGEIVRAVLALADAMKLSVVAEGIDSIHQLHQLMVLSCEYGQGYLFSHPLPAHEFRTLLDDPSRWETLMAGNSFSILSPTTNNVYADVR
ncbi:MAG: hypothetical protein DMF62_01285 [Acidobacteria bacterium]|nr:MAG: hypothetical protein DMF62_01285 [Acidobacteriota bacterium]